MAPFRTSSWLANNPVGSWNATRFNPASDTVGSISRLSALPPITDFTIMAWIRIVVDRNLHSFILMFGSSATPWYLAGLGADGTTFVSDNNVTQISGTNLTVGVWYHIAMTVSGTGTGQFLAYLNGALNIVNDGNSAIPQTAIAIGDRTIGVVTEPFDGRVAALKIFNTALSPQQIQYEMSQFVPVHQHLVNGWYPLGISNFWRIKDYGPYRRNFSDSDPTRALESGPPIPWMQVRNRPLRIDVPSISSVTIPGWTGAGWW